MPSGPPELHEKWGDDLTAMRFLKERGFTLLRSYQWVLPDGRFTPDEEELSAISYLFIEWDFDPCWLCSGCVNCVTARAKIEGWSPMDSRLVRFFACVECGNKRCPHATDHRHKCTGSNEPGQPGSRYE